MFCAIEARNDFVLLCVVRAISETPDTRDTAEDAVSALLGSLTRLVSVRGLGRRHCGIWDRQVDDLAVGAHFGQKGGLRVVGNGVMRRRRKYEADGWVSGYH